VGDEASTLSSHLLCMALGGAGRVTFTGVGSIRLLPDAIAPPAGTAVLKAPEARARGAVGDSYVYSTHPNRIPSPQSATPNKKDANSSRADVEAHAVRRYHLGK
jgi:hypothetical protein